MVTLPELIHFSARKRLTTGFRPGHHNVTLGATAILSHRHIVWCESYLDTLSRLGVVHESVGRTDGIAIATSACNTLYRRAPKTSSLSDTYREVSIGKRGAVLSEPRW